MKSVKSIIYLNPCLCRQAGVIQTTYDIVKAHGGVPIAIGMKVETEKGTGSAFKIILPYSA